MAVSSKFTTWFVVIAVCLGLTVNVYPMVVEEAPVDPPLQPRMDSFPQQPHPDTQPPSDNPHEPFQEPDSDPAGTPPVLFGEFRTRVDGSSVSPRDSGGYPLSPDQDQKQPTDVSLEGQRRVRGAGTFEFKMDVEANEPGGAPSPSRGEVNDLYGRLRRPGNYDLKVGTVSMDLSEFSHSSPRMAGVRLKRDLESYGLDELRVFGGHHTWESGDEDGGLIGGVRLSGSSGGMVRHYGFNYSRARGSGRTSNSPAANPASSSEVYSLDGVLRLAPELNLRGEWAVEQTGALDAENSPANRALRLETGYRLDSWKGFSGMKLQAQYERVGAGFGASTGGYQSLKSDLSGEWHRSEAGWLPTLDWEYGYRLHRDRLGKPIEETTQSAGHRLGVEVDLFEEPNAGETDWGHQIRENLSAAARYRMAEMNGSDTVGPEILYRQNYSLSTRVDDHALSVSYGYQVQDDRISRRSDYRVRKLSLDYDYEGWEWDLGFVGEFENDLSLRFKRTRKGVVNPLAGVDRSKVSLRLNQILYRDWESEIDWSRIQKNDRGSGDGLEKTRLSLSVTPRLLKSHRSETSLRYRLEDREENVSYESNREQELRVSFQFRF